MRKGVFAETHHSCLEAESLQPFLPERTDAWKTQVSLGHGSLTSKMGEEEGAEVLRTEAPDGVGGSGRTEGVLGGLHTRVHIHEHMWVVHTSANACGVCLLDHGLSQQNGRRLENPQTTARTENNTDLSPLDPIQPLPRPTCPWLLPRGRYVLTRVHVLKGVPVPRPLTSGRGQRCT